MRAARSQGKPLVVEFWASWCKPCARFERNVLPRPRVRATLARTVFVRYNLDERDGAATAARFGVRTIPAIYVITNAQIVRAPYKAMMSAGSFSAFVRAAMTARESTQHAPALLARARFHRAARDLTAAVAAYERAAAADAGNRQGIAAVAIREKGALERRKLVLAQLAEYVDRFPADVRAADALAIVAIAGELTSARVNELVDKHINAVAGDTNRLEHAIYVGLAGGALDAALRAAKLMAKRSLSTVRRARLLADVHMRRHEWDEARAAVDAAWRSTRDKRTRRALAVLRDRISNRKHLAPRVRLYRRSAEAYLRNIEWPWVFAMLPRVLHGGRGGRGLPPSLTRAREPLPSLQHSVRPSAFTHSYLAARITTGISHEAAVGLRGAWAFGKLADLHGLTAVNAYVGRAEAQLSYDAQAMVGLGVTRTGATFALLTGVGASKLGDTLAASLEVPLEMRLMLASRSVRGYAWARASYLPATSGRKHGSTHAMFSGDELSLGVALRYPAHTKKGVLFGVSYREAGGGHMAGLTLGTSLDSFGL